MENRPIQKTLRLSKVDYYETHLAFLNAVLPVAGRLTPMELKVLAKFMSFDEDIPMGRFGTYARGLVKEAFENMSTASLSNYIKYLKNKRFIIERENNLYLIPIIQIPASEQVYTFKIINNG